MEVTSNFGYVDIIGGRFRYGCWFVHFLNFRALLDYVNVVLRGGSLDIMADFSILCLSKLYMIFLSLRLGGRV
jgi:hypothetical protein